MAESVGAAAARGIESGFGLGMRAYEAQANQELRQQELADRKEDRASRRAREQAETDFRNQQIARQERSDANADLDAQLKFADSDAEALKSEYAGLLQQAGNDPRKIDPNALSDWNSRLSKVTSTRNDLRTRRFQPMLEGRMTAAADTASRLATGQVSIDDISDNELHDAVQFQARRPVDDFISGDGIKPSPVRQGINDFQAGLETGNEGLMMRGLNVLFRPELTTGIGALAHDGSEIINKEIYALAPHPDVQRAQQGDMVPVLEVTARRPDGAIGKYRSIVTQDRSNWHGNDSAEPMVINLKTGMDHIGQMGTLEASLNQPGIKERLTNGKTTSDAESQDAFQHYLRLGGKMPTKKPVKRENTDLGDRVETNTVDADTGEIISTTTRAKNRLPPAGGLKGAGGGKSSQLEKKLATIDAMVEDGELTEEEGASAKKRAVGLGAAGGAGGKESPETKKAEAREAVMLISQARELLKGGATGSYAGKAYDQAARFFGLSTDGAQKAGALKALEGALVAKMPKMSGPQSDRDVQLYRQQAALVGDDTLPVKTRLAALDTVEEIQLRYAGGAATEFDTAQKKSGGVTESAARPKNKAEFDKLPSGALFVDPNGVTRRKP